jgi:hypothetical protein
MMSSTILSTNSFLNSQVNLRTNSAKKFHLIKLNKTKNSKDAKVNIYGSMAYGICTNDTMCDIDVDFDNSSSKSSSHILRDVCEVLKNEMSDTFDAHQINKLFNGDTSSKASKQQSSQSVNKISLAAKRTIGCNQKILFNFTSGLFATAYKTSTLIKAYFELDERLKILSFCLRHIAKV